MSNQTDFAILYGSQTGNAEDMAKRIGSMARMNGLVDIQVLAIDDFQLKLLPKLKFVLFVCATTGHGQEPENMKNFYNFIRRRDLPSDCLQNLKYAIYGLGSTSYAKFNYVSKIVFKRLRECGAEPIQELVASDEQHPYGCDGLVYPKLEELWPTLESLNFCETSKLNPRQNSLKPNSYAITLYGCKSDLNLKSSDKYSVEFKEKYSIKEATCITNERLTPESHFQDTRFLRFRAESSIEYEPGDVCTIYPENSQENIDEFLRILDLDGRTRVRVCKQDANYMINYLYDFIPDGLELQDLVRCYLDIQSVPKRSFFEYLWPFSEDEMEREKLKEFASTEGQAGLYEYCIKPKRTILETMLDFRDSIKKVKLEYLLDMIPPIKPRSFSIASAWRLHPNEIHLLVGVVSYRTSMKRTRLGLCSNFLASMQAGTAAASQLRFLIRRTSFKLPQDSSTPIIMIGPGLGLSPFRSFVQHLSSTLEGSKQGRERRLYFGCRFRERDYYFRKELEDYQQRGVISLRVAFSREQLPKEYVQDRIREDGDLVRELIRGTNGAIVYVAGNSRLPEELRSLLGQILTAAAAAAGQQPAATGDWIGRPDSLEGERLVMNLEANNRIQYDCW